MPTAVESRVATLRKHIAEQEDWIRQCGGGLIGYTERYGSAADPDHYGDGAEAIFSADIQQLHRLRSELAHLTGVEAPFALPLNPSVETVTTYEWPIGTGPVVSEPKVLSRTGQASTIQLVRVSITEYSDGISPYVKAEGYVLKADGTRDMRHQYMERAWDAADAALAMHLAAKEVQV